MGLPGWGLGVRYHTRVLSSATALHSLTERPGRKGKTLGYRWQVWVSVGGGGGLLLWERRESWWEKEKAGRKGREPPHSRHRPHTYQVHPVAPRIPYGFARKPPADSLSQEESVHRTWHFTLVCSKEGQPILLFVILGRAFWLIYFSILFHCER